MAVEEIYCYPDDYDFEVAARNPNDFQFWRELLVREQPEHVLEIGCGTGRLTLPLARMGAEQGFHMVGLDIEPEMLTRARLRAAAEPDAVRNILQLEMADVRALKMAARFDVVFLPYGVAHHLISLDDQLAALHGIHELLMPHGLFAIDVCAPDFSLLARAIIETGRYADMNVHGDDGRNLRRTVVMHYFPETQLLTQDFEYDVTDADGTQRHYRSPFLMHVYYPRELAWLFQLTGFRLEYVYGSYNGEAFGATSPSIIALARKTLDPRSVKGFL